MSSKKQTGQDVENSGRVEVCQLEWLFFETHNDLTIRQTTTSTQTGPATRGPVCWQTGGAATEGSSSKDPLMIESSWLTHSHLNVLQHSNERNEHSRSKAKYFWCNPLPIAKASEHLTFI